MTCKICNAAVRKFGEATILGKYQAEYDQCSRCGFISARQPIWLKEAYSSVITSSDLGTVSRTEQNSLKTRAVVDFFFSSAKSFVDYGAGYGMFVRRMRDLGYDFYAYDLHCENLFARQFQLPGLHGRKFDLVTAFEVFEHVENPLEVFDHLLAHGDQLIFSTNLLPTPAPAPADWWYYGLEHGQHVSFYTRDALRIVADAHKRYFYSNGEDFHLLSSKRISSYWFGKIVSERLSRWVGMRRRRRSLLNDDFIKNRNDILAKLGYPVT